DDLRRYDVGQVGLRPRVRPENALRVGEGVHRVEDDLAPATQPHHKLLHDLTPAAPPADSWARRYWPRSRATPRRLAPSRCARRAPDSRPTAGKSVAAPPRGGRGRPVRTAVG